MKIIGTGLSGLVGSRIVDLLQGKHSFENISLSTGCDISVKEDVLSRISSSDAEWVIHMAAKANVDACQKDKAVDQQISKKNDSRIWEGKNTAWAVNVIGTKNIVQACEKSHKKLLHISTDFVFDGEKDFYTEEDTRKPINWYATTKSEAEKLVESSNTHWVIIRIAYPYRLSFERKDFVRIVVQKLKEGKTVSAISDHIMTPTFVDDIAIALDTLMSVSPKGIFHVVGSQFITPLDAAKLIASVFQLDSSKIMETTRSVFFLGRAPRPFRLAIRNDKIQQLGVYMRTFKEGLFELKKEILL